MKRAVKMVGLLAVMVLLLFSVGCEKKNPYAMTYTFREIPTFADVPDRKSVV